MHYQFYSIVKPLNNKTLFTGVGFTKLVPVLNLQVV
ncbi:hypothetical protein P872_19535 [Rhodonellum psychrophilum GCM71 = DSM 17998]|uniref:Uncharacterized protein n=2 Tax=Rhodonellum TaxID=336827 RepID=U5BYG6_9BACT|nr:hypothetical protein P872_19535 [Rhodonellum psychrophilum GCM71 = DSM 17998]SDY83363.1 hypothetical protein SAMN05444412_10377 [Rhodonellum ikkaensis]